MELVIPAGQNLSVIAAAVSACTPVSNHLAHRRADDDRDDHIHDGHPHADDDNDDHLHDLDEEPAHQLATILLIIMVIMIMMVIFILIIFRTLMMRRLMIYHHIESLFAVSACTCTPVSNHLAHHHGDDDLDDHIHDDHLHVDNFHADDD